MFPRCADGREHRLALRTLGRGLDYIMIEVATLDDVGRAVDRCLEASDWGHRVMDVPGQKTEAME
jgi:hypothetical protein